MTVTVASVEGGAEKLAKVVSNFGVETLPLGKVEGGNGRIGIVVGSVNGGAVEVVARLDIIEGGDEVGGLCPCSVDG